MQVAIIGAGIGGLSTYLWLKELLPHQEDHDIMIYESQQSAKPRVTYDNPDFTPVAPDAEGSTLILDPSGLKVLQRLGDEVFHNVVGTGAPISSHWYRSSRGFSLTNTPAGELEPERMTCVAISRQGLWNCLRRRIPDYAIQIAQVSEVLAGGSGKIIRFNDGTYSVTADVVIGADGVNSVVRKAVLGEQKYRELAPVYAGMVSVGGFMASYHLPEDKKQKGAITRVMGRRGYFDYGSITSPLSEPSRHLPIRALPTGEQAWWDSVYMIAECPDKRTLNKDDIRKQLKERHGNWKDPTTRYCIEQGEIEGVYCIFSMPMLPLWDNDNVILIGDAAHTLLPSSGHGACQALEDAEALARLTSHFLHKVYGSISDDSDFQIDEGQAIAVAMKSMIWGFYLKLEDALNEVKNLQRLRHAHIVRLVGSYTQERNFSLHIIRSPDMISPP